MSKENKIKEIKEIKELIKELIKEMKEEFEDLSDFEKSTCWHGGVRQCLMYTIKKLENIYSNE